MRIKFPFMAAVICAMTMSLPLMSCGDDDDDQDAPVPTPELPANPASGLTAITAMGQNLFTFSHDAAGHVTGIRGADLKMTISYSPLTITLEDDGDKTVWSNIATNTSGYITRATLTDEEDTWTMTFSYDSKGHLTSLNDGEDTSIFTWNNAGNLTNVNFDGDAISYMYANQLNTAGAFSPMWLPLGPYWMTGLFGAAPTNLPSKITSSYDGVCTFAYTLNENGTIATEQISYDDMDMTMTLNYVYGGRSAADENFTVKLPSLSKVFKKARR